MSDTIHRHAGGPGRLLKMLGAYRSSGVLAAGIELGFFSALAGGPRSADEVAAQTGCVPEKARVLLDALVSLEVLRRDDGAYALTDGARDHLVPGAGGFLGDTASLLTEPTMWRDFRRLADFARSGDDGALAAETPEHPFWKVFARQSVSLSEPAAAALVAALDPWLAGRADARALDVACGSGTYGLALARHFDRSEVTLCDWPNVLADARRTADDAGLGGRVRLLPGDATRVDFGGPYDLVLLSHILHHVDRPTGAALVRKGAAALKPGGKLVVQDYVRNDTAASAMFAVMMMTLTRRGGVYDEAGYRELLEGAGLAEATVLRGYVREPVAYFIATKPATASGG